MKGMTNEQRQKIRQRIKNKKFIDDLVNDYEIKNEDLSYAKIKKFIRNGQDISGVNLCNALITEECEISGAKAQRVIFHGLRIECKGWFRMTDFRHSDFSFGYFPYIDYSYADFRDVKFCDSILCVGGTKSKGAKFDRKILKEFIGLGRL